MKTWKHKAIVRADGKYKVIPLAEYYYIRGEFRRVVRRNKKLDDQIKDLKQKVAMYRNRNKVLKHYYKKQINKGLKKVEILEEILTK